MLFLLLLILILFLYLFKNNSCTERFEINPCIDNLTDRQYLEHMIPHHQVAVDISILLQKKSKSPVIQDILRKLIWTQKYEIELMKNILLNISNNKINNFENNYYIPTKSDFISPNKLGITKTYCDPHFFDPDGHMKHLEHMTLDNESYIKHMIPHHQVAVDMSKILLKNTKNDFMIYLAYRIIRNQKSEIIILNNLLEKNIYMHSSKLI